MSWFPKRYRSPAWLVLVTGLLLFWVALPIAAQLPLLTELNWPAPVASGATADSAIVTECIHLDGRCLFKISDQRRDIQDRASAIQTRLDEVSESYFGIEGEPLQVFAQAEGNLQDIYLQIGDRPPVRLLTVTSLDAEIVGTSIAVRAEQLAQSLQQDIEQARAARQPKALVRQAIAAGITIVVMALVTAAISRFSERSRQRKAFLLAREAADGNQPISARLDRRKERSFTEIQYRSLQVTQLGIWFGGSLLILGLFPYTSGVQAWILRSLRIPFRLVLVGLATYFIIRLSYAAIDRSSAIIASNYHLGEQESDRRLQLRISTVSGVAKGAIAASLTVVGLVGALAAVGIDIGPLLAGAGIVGLAISFASQNLIKDALNGFLIVLEDQYAIGDVIAVGEVAGFVENLNLRITQLRDAEGRLITIPNSEIRTVANLSSKWSRADLNIPVAYQTDIDFALGILKQVAEQMDSEAQWQEYIIEPPTVLGVESFGDWGLVIKVWIKTQPLKQWDVAREFRRRIKVAFTEAGIPLPLPHQFALDRSSSLDNWVFERKDGHSARRQG